MTRLTRTPIPAIRRVTPRRDMRARLRAVDPFAVAAGESLVLPDRHGALQVVDQGAARIERCATVAAGHRHDDGEVADGQVTNSVNGSDGVDVEPRRDPLSDVAQLVGR